MAKKIKQLHSSYWLDMDQFEYDVDRLEEQGQDIIGLIKYRNVISNFVNILTGKQIPVEFAVTGDSHTDGERIIISAARDASKFDVNVGLALHEASHVVLTDFKVLSALVDCYYSHSNPKYPNIYQAYKELPESVRGNMSSHHTIKSLLNIIEDRRIDQYVRTTAPGYCGYYDALYEEYFINDTTTNAIRDKRYRTVTIESYLLHICSIVNPNSDPKALPGLDRIFSMIDLPNISRLKTTEDAAVLAIQVLCEIYKHITADTDAPFENKETGDMVMEAGDTAGNENGDTDQGEGIDTESSAESGEGSASDGEGTDGALTTGETFKPSMESRIDKAVRNMMDALNSETKKKKISKADKNSMKSMNEHVDILSTTDAGGTFKGVTVLLVENLTPSDLWDEGGNRNRKVEIGGIRHFFSNCSNWKSENYLEIINDGFGYGARISKQLRTRAEERRLDYNRLKRGKIDPRRIAYANAVEDIFYRTRTERYPDSYIHISLDASGSMGGRKWEETLRFTSALAKACELANNIHLTVDVRIDAGRYPAVVIMYDNKRHGLDHFRTMFSTFDPNSSTPEGLCLNALSKWIQKKARGRKSLFINFSDGEPCYTMQGYPHYSDAAAYKHTKATVRDIRDAGISVLAYYIDAHDNMHDGFQEMYGESAKSIRPADMSKLVNTINQNQMSESIVEWV